MLGSLVRRKKLLLLMGVFVSVVASLIIGFSAQVRAAEQAPTLTMDDSEVIVATGGWIEQLLKSMGEGRLQDKDSEGRDSMFTGYYKYSKFEIYFKRSAPGSNVYQTPFYNFFNAQADPKCIPTLTVASFENPTASVGGTWNPFLDWEASPYGDPNNALAKECDETQKKYNQWNGTLSLTYRGPAVIEGDAQNGYQGVEIKTCAAGDSACISQRNSAINEADAAYTCGTQSIAAIQQCNTHKAIIACLKDDPTKSVSNCKDHYDAIDILAGRTSIIDASTSDTRIQEICNTLENDTDRATCIANAQGAKLTLQCTADPTLEQCGDFTNATTCVIDGVGWFVCAVTNFLASVTDNVYMLIENLIRVPAINTDTSSGTNGVFNAWALMRSIANVAFVIVFLIIIFAQLTGQGVSNYGVKKTLPRLIVAAILVNVSFWISAIAVDLSNIAGAGLYQVLQGVRDSMNVGISANWANIAAALMAGQALAIPAATGAVVAGVAISTMPGVGLSLLFLLLPLVLGAVLAVLTVALVLIARQALVIILIIVSPLAFVAFLLPNTEGLFTKWRKLLVSLLLLYPIVAIIFGGAQIAGLAVLSTAAGMTDPITDIIPTGIAIISGQFITVAPLFFIPLILTKFAGGGLERLAGNIRSQGQKLIGGISGASREEGRTLFGRSFRNTKYGEARKTFNRSGNETLGSRVRGIVRTGGRAFDQRRARGKLTDSFLAEEQQIALTERLASDQGFALAAAAGSREGATRLQAEAEAEAIKKALQPLLRTIAGMNSQDKENHLKGEVAAGGIRAAAALQYSASIGDSGAMRDYLAHPDTQIRRMAQEAVNAHATAILPKAPDLVKGEKAAFKSVKGADLATFDAKTAAAYMDYLSRISGQEQIDAMEAFQGAVEDISRSADLQSRFGAETGKAIRAAAASGHPAAGIASLIRQDGKIR